MSRPKTDNARAGEDAKREMRARVLEHVEPAHVLEGYAGSGVMSQVWARAASLASCDVKDWEITDRPRFVCDVRMLLRALDLSRFNVFDFDAYGSPWEAMAILAARRTWGAGELGAVVLTDGSPFYALRQKGARLRGASDLGAAPTPSADTESALAIGGAALRGWARRSNVEPLHAWQARSRGSGLGGMVMIYTAFVFRGQSTKGKER